MKIPVIIFCYSLDEADKARKSASRHFGSCLFDPRIRIVEEKEYETRKKICSEILTGELEGKGYNGPFIVCFDYQIQSSANADTIAQRVNQLTVLQDKIVVLNATDGQGEELMTLPDSEVTLHNGPAAGSMFYFPNPKSTEELIMVNMSPPLFHRQVVTNGAGGSGEEKKLNNLMTYIVIGIVLFLIIAFLGFYFGGDNIFVWLMIAIMVFLILTIIGLNSAR